MIISTLLGVATGATVTTFLSKYSGPERRQRIRQKITDDIIAVDEMKLASQRVVASSQHLKATMSELLPPFMEEVEQLKNEAEFQLTPRIDRVKKAIEQLQRDLPQS